jgi:hypothetical protein
MENFAFLSLLRFGKEKEMYKLLLFLAALLGIVFYGSQTKAQMFTKPSVLFCDKTEEVQDFLRTEGYVKIVSGITETITRKVVYNVIYGKKESILFVTHFSEGYSCFVAEINNIDDYGFGLEGLPDMSKPQKES